MKVGIIHHTLNSCGGGELLSLTMAKALKEHGFEVTYYTTQKTDWNYVNTVLGVSFKPDREKCVFKIKIPYFGIYQRLIAGFFNQAIKECDLVVNTHGDVMPFVNAHVTYMHYPTFSLWYENPVNVKYLRSVFWKTYFIPYYTVQKYLIRKITGLILTNSRFSAKAIEKHVGRKAAVVYPPVNIEPYLKLLKNPSRENIVVTVGRFTPEKRYEVVLEVAATTPNIKYVIIGSISNRLNKQYYSKIAKMIKSKRLNNVILMPNLPFKSKLEILSKAKIYLHTMVNEHFGIAIVEGMAAGLVPVVHMSGGAWEDILDGKQGVHGYAFRDVDEAVEYIENLVSDESLRREIVLNNSKHVWKFSSKKFEEKIVKIVEAFTK